MVYACAWWTLTEKVMPSPLLTLTAEAYPLICWWVSSAMLGYFQMYQASVPGCWFSTTMGLSAAWAALDTSGLPGTDGAIESSRIISQRHPARWRWDIGDSLHRECTRWCEHDRR